jgi:hypothetical protein
MSSNPSVSSPGAASEEKFRLDESLHLELAKPERKRNPLTPKGEPLTLPDPGFPQYPERKTQQMSE